MKKILLFTFIILLLNSCSLNLKNLPIPEGNFKIGTDTFIFEDKSRLEWFTEDNENDYRKIAVQMWYPSSEISDSLHPYIDNDIKLKYIDKDCIGISIGNSFLCMTNEKKRLPFILSQIFPLLPIPFN